MRPTRTMLVCLAAVTLLTTAGSLPASGSTPRTRTGTVRILVVDDLGERSAATPGDPGTAAEQGGHTRAVADVDGQLLDIPEPQAASLRSGDTVSVTSTPGSTEATSVVPVGGTARAAAVTRPDVVGSHTLTVLPVYWTTPDPNAPLSTLTALAAGTADYWSQQSGGRIAITPRVRDWTRIADPGSCSSSALANAAVAANGLSLPTSMTDHVLIYFPRRADCGGWAGLGQVGGPLIWDNGYPLLDVTSHELGHNLGLGHANTATCTSSAGRVTLSSSCSVAEYRDYADVMGIAMDAPTGSLNTALADSLGLVQSVTAAPGARTSVDLAPITNANAVRAVRIRLAGGWVYLDHRPAAGRDTRMPGWAGVQVHYLPDDSIPASQLLDAQPQSAFSTVSLPPGSTWTVPGTGLGVTVTTVTSAGAHVEVAPVESVQTPPTPVITSPAASSVVGSTVTLGWRIASAVTGLRLALDGRQVSATTTSALSGTVRLTGLTNGSHSLTLQAVNAAGQTSALSTPLKVIADLTPPSIPAGLALSSAQVLSWKASSDAVSGLAGYLVAMDGGATQRLGTVTSLATRTPVGRHTWWVAAVDRIGNVSPSSGIVVVRATAKVGAKATSVRVVSSSATSSGQRALVTGRTVGASHPL